METPDINDYKVTSEVHVFSEGNSSDETKHEGKPSDYKTSSLIY